VEIHVLQGEREMARYNRSLGRFHLMGLPPAPRGMPQIEVTFDIDANGILHVSAKDMGTSKEQSIRIEASSGLAKDEVERMTQDAASHAADDKRLREEAEAKNRADQLVYTTEKIVAENRDKLPAEDVSRVEAAIADVKTAMQEGGLERIQTASENLTRASHHIAELIYSRSGAGGAGGQPGGGPAGPGPEGQSKEGEVIDAEYVDVEDKK
jgi:molecular chaperone DnaK